MKILGLDVSTSKTGWCLIDSNGSLEKMGCVDLTSAHDLFEKTEILIKVISEETAHLREVYEVVIEEPLLSFARGMSSASTLLTLNRFNGMVTYACWRDLRIKPRHLNVIFARRSLGIKKNKGENIKDVVMTWVAGSVVDYVWPTKVISRGKRKGETVFEPYCYDVADAYVMAKAAHCGRVKSGVSA